MIRTGEQLSAALARTRDEVSAFFRSVPPETFTHSTQEQWSPAHHLDHLTRSNGPVGKALSLPRDRLPQVKGTRPSRSSTQIRDLYHEALSGGVKASGRYLPEPSGDRTGQLAEYGETLDALRASLTGWTEDALDRHALPHPVLGELSVREMIEFTLYHNGHHLKGVQASLKRLPEQP